MEWNYRIILDFETAPPPKSSTKKKKDSQMSSNELSEAMDRACLHVWLMTSEINQLRVMKSLSGAKLEKYKSLWNRGPSFDRKLGRGSRKHSPTPVPGIRRCLLCRGI